MARASLKYAVILSLLLIPAAATSAPRDSEPGGTPTDVTVAVTNPHEYAWQLFFFLNRQALPGKAGEVDPNKETIRDFDDDKAVVWETWALASGGILLAPGEVNRSEVFRSRGETPVKWDELSRDTSEKLFDFSLTDLAIEAGTHPNTVSPSNSTFKFSPEPGEPCLLTPRECDVRSYEVRMNKSTFETIRANNLYSIEGLEAKFVKAITSDNRDIIAFDPAAKEIKAKWIRLCAAMDAKCTELKKKYHWRSLTARDGKTREIWGLSALHIITRDLPNWFWTDFEHVDFERHAKTPSVDPTTRGLGAPSGKDGLRNETAGTKWQYYRLRGVQTEYVDKFGKPTILADTQIEPDESHSSCITCHALATVGLRARTPTEPYPRALAAEHLPPKFEIGVPDPNAFFDLSKLKYIQTHFLWSVPFRAHSTNE